MHGIHSRGHRGGELASFVGALIAAGGVDEDDARAALHAGQV